MAEIKVPDNDHPSIEKYIPEGYVPTENDINFVFNWNKYVTDRILENVSLAVIKDILDIFSVQIQDIENQEVILIPWDPDRCIARRDIYGGDPEYSNSVLLTSENIQHEMKQPGVLSVELASVLKYAQNGYLYQYLDYQLLTGFAQNLLTIYAELKGMMKQPIQFHWNELQQKESPVDLRKESIRIENNENPEICSKCGGKCCKNFAGAYHPHDFDELETVEDFERILIDGKISIDWYEGFTEDGQPGYFLRPRHVGGDVIDPSWGGVQCIHLTDTGCELSFDERPYFCKKLEPHTNNKCSEPDIKHKYAEAWFKYHNLLKALRRKYDKQTATGTKNPMAYFVEMLYMDEMMNDEDDK